MDIHSENDLAHLWKLPHGVYRIVKPSLELEFRQHSTFRGQKIKFHSFEVVGKFESVQAADSFIRNPIDSPNDMS